MQPARGAMQSIEFVLMQIYEVLNGRKRLMKELRSYKKISLMARLSGFLKGMFKKRQVVSEYEKTISFARQYGKFIGYSLSMQEKQYAKYKNLLVMAVFDVAMLRVLPLCMQKMYYDITVGNFGLDALYLAFEEGYYAFPRQLIKP
jgi:hypothetical protein